MKQVKKQADPALATFYKKSETAKKAAAKALISYEKQLAACEEARDKKLDKNAIFELVTALKIAKFVWKIKKTEQKLAKHHLKAAEKAAPKTTELPAPAAEKSTPKKSVAAKSAKHKKGESVTDQGKTVAAKVGKKGN